MLPLFDRSSAFENLIDDVQACRLCPEMEGCTRVLSWGNGSPDASIMFVGEAPGRLGADRTAVPFHGDKAGDNFERLISLAGLRRSEIFVTNAVLCNPKDESGNNASPSRAVLRRCAENLRRQIDVVQPSLVVTLGSAALESTRLIEHHELALSRDVRTECEWYGRKLLPLYHPGARAMIHRNFAAQTADYYFVGETYRRIFSGRRRATTSVRPRDGFDWDVVQHVLSRLGRATLFRLHKTMYLIDCQAVRQTGKPLTGFFYIRQKDGPYCVELGGGWHRAFQDSIRFSQKAGLRVLEWCGNEQFAVEVQDGQRRTIESVLDSVSSLNDAQLKARAYLTKPMRAALAAEKTGKSQLNRPLL
jgi:uracil-DNA glycosylase family 4